MQRTRILTATFGIVAERGAANVTVAHIGERSGVSRRTFYEQFEGREDCLFAAFERALMLAWEDVFPAYDAAKGWRERVKAGLIALLCFCDREPSIAHLLLCESQEAGLRVQERRREAIGWLIRIVDEGREEGKAQGIPSLTAEAIVGGVFVIVQARLLKEAHGEPLVTLANELMSMIVLPYMGAAMARRELERPVPAPVDGRRGVFLSDPFRDAGMRLTYRTVRVLMAIAEHPRTSNREIGTNAGIADQGQISKLLGRLERTGLITNTGINPGKGASNSWALSEKGQQVADSIQVHTQASTHTARRSDERFSHFEI